MSEITLKLKVEEVNAVLNALGAQPYAQVSQLITKIQTQGSSQLQDSDKVEQAPDAGDGEEEE